MKVWTSLSEAELEATASELDLLLWGFKREGRGYRFTLKPTSDRYRRRGWRGQRIYAVCWHGYRDFLARLFDADPEARVKSILAEYRGREEFLRRFQATAWVKVASQAAPLHYAGMCDCEG